MKVKKILYEKLFNLGNFENEKIGIEIEVEGNEEARDALNKPKIFVELKGYNCQKEREIK